MAIHTMWDDRAKTRVLIEFESEWSWADLENALYAVDQYISSVSHPVDLIIDVESSTLPKDFMTAAKNFLGNSENPRSNEGHRIVVGASQIIRSAYQTLQKTFGERLVGREFVFAEDLNQARSMLHSMRLT